MLEIRKCTVAEIEGTAEFWPLVDEYAAEVKVDGAPPIAVKVEQYRYLEGLGVFHFFGAYLDDRLIGFVTVLLTVLPHFGVVMAVTESLFVAKEHRNTAAWPKLKKTAEDCAINAGSPCLLISTPYGGALAKVLSRSSGYKPTNMVFFRNLQNVH